MKAFLALEDGTVYSGASVGAQGTVIGEIVFNTSMTGYQEALTDPSHHGQIVAMTYPLIGNCGVNGEDGESDRVQARGFVVRELCKTPSNWRMTGRLDDYLKANNIVAIEGIDTRELTRKIREKGVMGGVLSTDPAFDFKACKEKIEADKSAARKKVEVFPAENARFNVAMLDFGVKQSLVRRLAELGCGVTAFPALTPPETILRGAFDGIVLSNGPGDPKEYREAIETVKTLRTKQIPIFGICLGHQIAALAAGLDTEKMKCGHRGSNHPVTDNETGRTFITSQNHGYVVKRPKTEAICGITHINLNDKTVEGIRYKDAPIFTVQFFPEIPRGAAGAHGLFERFIALMESIG